MLKRILLPILIFISYAGIAQDLTATIKAPGSVQPGNDLTVEITVNKPGVSGFMKYFQELPAGYSATDLDSKGGSFSYADNGAKIIWITPPSSDQFVITYKINVPATASGNLPLGGKFSYVLGNERKMFELPGQTVAVGSGTGSASSEPVKEIAKETPPPVEPKTEEPKSTPPPAEEKKLVNDTPAPPPVEEKPTPVETKKETPVVVTPVNKAPTSAAPSSTPGRSYRVQIGAFNQKPHIDGVPQPSTVVLDNGMTKFFSGNFKTYEEAKKRKMEMLDKGFQGAFIVSFENGKIVK